MYIIKRICLKINAQKGGFVEPFAKPVQTLGSFIGAWELKTHLVEYFINTTFLKLILEP